MNLKGLYTIKIKLKSL